MNSYKSIRFVIMAFLVYCVNPVTATDLASLKSEYGVSKQKIDSACAAEFKSSLLVYSKALTASEAQLKNAGNLEGLIAVRKEKERFVATGEIPKTSSSDTPQAIAQAQLEHLTRTQQAQKVRDKNLAVVIRQYLSKLDALKKQLTSRDKIDDALQVQTEIKNMETILAVLSGEQETASAAQWKDITDTFSGGNRQLAGIVLKNQRTTSRDSYKPPLEIEYVCKTDSANIRLAYACDQLIFNWENNLNELRIDGGPANRQHRMGAGRVPVNKFITIRQVVNKDKMDVFVEGQLCASWQADFSNVNSPISIFTVAKSTVTVKSLKIKHL